MRFGGKSSHNQSQVTREIVPVLISLTVREEVAEEEVRTHEQAVILRCVIQMMFRSRPSQASDEHIQTKLKLNVPMISVLYGKGDKRSQEQSNVQKLGLFMNSRSKKVTGSFWEFTKSECHMLPKRLMSSLIFGVFAVSFSSTVQSNPYRELAIQGCEAGAKRMAPIVMHYLGHMKDLIQTRSQSELAVLTSLLRERFEKIEDQFYEEQKEIEASMKSRWDREGVSPHVIDQRMMGTRTRHTSLKSTVWIAYSQLIKTLSDNSPSTAVRIQRNVEEECTLMAMKSFK